MASTTRAAKKPDVYLEGYKKPIDNMRYVLLTGEVPQIHHPKYPTTLLLNGGIRVGSEVQSGAHWGFGLDSTKTLLLPHDLPGYFDQQLATLNAFHTRFPEEQTSRIAHEEDAVPRSVVTVSLPGWRYGRDPPYRPSYSFTPSMFSQVSLREVAFARATQHEKYLNEMVLLGNKAFGAANEIRSWAYVWVKIAVPLPTELRQAVCLNFTEAGFSTVFTTTPVVDNRLRWGWSASEPFVAKLVHYNNPKLSAELLLWGCTTT